MKLAPREKKGILLAVLVVGAAALLHFGVFPLLESRAGLRRAIAAKEQSVLELRQLSADYLARRQSSQGIEERLARRAPGFSLFSFLEQAAGAAGVKANIKYMKPSTSLGQGKLTESVVEVKLERISLEQLARYLEHIESPAEVVAVKRISIQTMKEGSGGLEVVVQVLTFLDQGA